MLGHFWGILDMAQCFQSIPYFWVLRLTFCIHPATVNLNQHSIIRVTHLFSNKRHITVRGKVPARKSMPKLINCPMAYASSFCCCFPDTSKGWDVKEWVFIIPPAIHWREYCSYRLLFLSLGPITTTISPGSFIKVNCFWFLRASSAGGDKEITLDSLVLGCLNVCPIINGYSVDYIVVTDEDVSALIAAGWKKTVEET